MKKLLLGALAGAVAVYFLDPERGAERRARVSSRWLEQKDQVLDVARQAGEIVNSASQGVTELVGQRAGGEDAG